MVSFGYSVGDIVALGSFAWNIYKSCKDAPESFAGVRQETLSLHAVLKEIEEALGECQLQSSQQERLQTICDGCKSVLEDLSALIQKYQSLGAQSQRTWDRLRWGKEDVDSLRNRLTSNVVLLSSFLQYGIWDPTHLQVLQLSPPAGTPMLFSSESFGNFLLNFTTGIERRQSFH